MRYLVVIILLFSFKVSSACMCMDGFDSLYSESITHGDIVIVGTSIRQVELENIAFQGYLIVVDGYFDGKSMLTFKSDSLIMVSSNSSCGITFENGERYIVAADTATLIKYRGGSYKLKTNELYVPFCRHIHEPIQIEHMQKFQNLRTFKYARKYFLWFNFLGYSDKSFIYEKLTPNSPQAL